MTDMNAFIRAGAGRTAILIPALPEPEPEADAPGKTMNDFIRAGYSPAQLRSL